MRKHDFITHIHDYLFSKHHFIKSFACIFLVLNHRSCIFISHITIIQFKTLFLPILYFNSIFFVASFVKQGVHLFQPIFARLCFPLDFVSMCIEKKNSLYHPPADTHWKRSSQISQKNSSPYYFGIPNSKLKEMVPSQVFYQKKYSYYSLKIYGKFF